MVPFIFVVVVYALRTFSSFFIIKYAFMTQLINGVEFRLIHMVVYFSLHDINIYNPPIGIVAHCMYRQYCSILIEIF